MNRIEYHHVHNINSLIIGVKSVYCDRLSYIYNYMVTIPRWESETRYVPNFLLELKDIKTVLPFVERLVEDVAIIDNYKVNVDNPIEKVTHNELIERRVQWLLKLY